MLLPQYTHIINPKLKHIYLSFDESGNLIIKSPKVSQKHIEHMLLKKASWINKSRAKIKCKKGKFPNFTQNPELYFLGQAHPIHLIKNSKKRTKLVFDGDIFSLYYNHYDESIFKTHIDKFYKQEAQNYIPDMVEQWAKTMKLHYHSISFRKTKRQWGSCSSNNHLSFNTMMMKLPLNVIQYIVVHELAHITHKHHQKEFWQLVSVYIPLYKTYVKELKNYTT